MTLSDMTPELSTQFKLRAGMKGLVIVSVDSDGPAAQRGVKPGEVLVEAGGQPVTTIAELGAQIEKARARGRALLRLLLESADGNMRFIALPMN